RPVHREELVVGLRVEHSAVGTCELQPHEQREDSADYEEGEARAHVAHGYRDVVDDLEEAEESLRLVPGDVELPLSPFRGALGRQVVRTVVVRPGARAEGTRGHRQSRVPR